MNNQAVDRLAKVLWEYHLMHQELQPAEAIFVLCSYDLRVAHTAARLYSQGMAPWILISGGYGQTTSDLFSKPEAEVFAEIIVKRGVPEDRLILETQSSNTGQNITFTYALLNKLGLHFNSFILVQKPYMERRTYATFKKQWPDTQTTFQITSPSVPYEAYVKNPTERSRTINMLVGYVERIEKYPKLGFQIPQPIPPTVRRAYEKLIALGYTAQLIGQ